MIIENCKTKFLSYFQETVTDTETTEEFDHDINTEELNIDSTAWFTKEEQMVLQYNESARKRKNAMDSDEKIKVDVSENTK